MESPRRHPRAGAVLLAAFLLALCPAARAVDFAGGIGEPNDPYLILTAGQLDCLAYQPGLWDRHFRLIDNLGALISPRI